MFFLIMSINNNNIAYNSIMITIIAWFNLDFEIRIFRLQYTRSCSRPCPLVDRYLSHPKSYLLAAILFKILCTMRVEWLAPIRHGSISIHGVVSMPSTIRLANTTEVDVGDSVWVCRDQDIVLVLKRNASLFSDRLFSLRRFLLLARTCSSLVLNALTQAVCCAWYATSCAPFKRSSSASRAICITYFCKGTCPQRNCYRCYKLYTILDLSLVY